jgi:hypothetical protein
LVLDVLSRQYLFEHSPRSLAVYDVDINADMTKIAWLQTGGEIFVAPLKEYKSEDIIQGFLDFKIQPFSKLESEIFNLG